ncbi:hypothetical protein HWI79_938 [Cryptosporidium felis]|nr:hypothetical protein HWI79_938 [Cryptosporidium felis]
MEEEVTRFPILSSSRGHTDFGEIIEKAKEESLQGGNNCSLDEIVEKKNENGIELFIVENNEFSLKMRLEQMSKEGGLLDFFKTKQTQYHREKILTLNQGDQVLVGLLLDSEYKLSDLIFDLSNSEKQSVLSNFTWEGQYQVLVSRKNNHFNLYDESDELNNLVNLDDGSYMSLIGVFEITKLKSKLYVFQCSIIIKPQYWNDLLNFDILIRYCYDRDLHDNQLFDDDDLDESMESIVGSFLLLKEYSCESSSLSLSLSKPILIKVPLTIPNYYLQESSQILYIEILNIGELSDLIIIQDIFSHGLKLYHSPDLPFTLESNQSLGCSLFKVREKKKLPKSHLNSENNIDAVDSRLPNIVPIFIKWKSAKTNSKLILTQFALQIHNKQIIEVSSTEKLLDENDKSPLGSITTDSPQASIPSTCSPCSYDTTPSSSSTQNNSIIQINDNSQFSATCNLDRISKFPGETIYLLIEIFPADKNKILNLEITVEYNQNSSIIPLFVSMPIHYIPDESSNLHDAHPTILYPLKICDPGIHKCPNVYIHDLATKSTLQIKKLPLLVCENNPQESQQETTIESSCDELINH